MPLFLRQTHAILWKDLKTEVRTKERLSAMCFFAFLIVLVFNFAFKPGSAIMKSAAPGIFWIAVTFAGLMGLTRSFTMERNNDCLMGLLLTPADRGAIYLGKMLANLITMLVMEALVLPLLVLFLNIDLWSCMPQILLPVFLGSLGFAAVGTLFAAMSINTRLQEALLPMLTLPILVPALLAAVESFGAILAGDPLSEVSSWLELSLAFSVLFITISLLLFDYVVEE